MAVLFAANIVVEWFGSIALMVLVYERTQSTAAAAILLVCKQVIPGVLVPFAGSQLERYTLERALVGALVVQSLSFATLAALGYGVPLLLVAGLAGLSGGVVRSCLRAGMACRLTDEEFAAGSAILNVAVGVAGVAGPALAALVISASGAGTALAIASCVLLLLVVGTAGLSLRSVGGGACPSDAEDSVQASHLPAIPLVGLLALVALVMGVFSMDEPALLAFSEHSLAAGVGGYGAIVFAWGLGITAGGIVFTRLLHWSMLRIYSVATLVAAVGYIGMGFSPSIEVAIAFALLGGIGNGMDWVAVVTLVKQATPKGREVWAATRLEAISTAAPGIGILAGGLLADFASPRTTLVLPGIAAVVAIAVSAIVLRLRSGNGAPSAAVTAERTLVPSIHGGTA